MSDSNKNGRKKSTMDNGLNGNNNDNDILKPEETNVLFYDNV